VASISWIFAEWILQGKPTTLGAASGALAGLVAITPAAGFVSPVSAIIIGLVAGVLCYMAVLAKSRLGYDDALDAVGVHGIGGIWGALATGLFASVTMNPHGANGLFFGNPHQFVIQAAGIGATMIYSFVVSVIILKAVDITVGLRVNIEEEVQGLDISQHSEVGYFL